MGSPAGASSNQPGPASVYTPTASGSADQLWQNIALNTLGPLAQNPAATPAGQAYTTAQGTTYNDIVNNPGYSTLSTLANLAPSAGISAYQSALAGNQAVGGTVPSAITAAANNPYYTQALGGAQQGAGIGGSAASSIGGQVPGLTSAASQVLNQAFDPNQALYNQTLNNVTQQAAAQNAFSGVSGSPYGQGLANQDVSNFNIAWQNNQLNNMATGASAANTLDTAALNAGSGASSLAASAGALPSSAYNTNITNALTAANTGATALGTSEGTTGSGITNLLAGASAPYNASNTQGSNTLSALTNLANLGTSQYGLSQAELGDLTNYLTVGQNASTISGNLGAEGQSELSNSLSGVGSLAGGLGLGAAGLGAS